LKEARAMTDIRDVYSRITAKIATALEEGIRPWHQPWNAEHASGRITRPLRHNGVPYNGINVVMLWSAAVTKGYARHQGLCLSAVADLPAGA
jgi:antirestriction protein ArdC